MRPHRIVLAVLGTTVLQLDVGAVDPPAPVEVPDDDGIGAVTDRRSAPIIGFSGAAGPPRDRRPVVR